MTEPPHIRIGELSRRVGVSPELLRAWEQRYGLLRPVRSPGGFRLFSADDEARVRSMRRHLEAGMAAAEAADRVLADAPSESPPTPALSTDELRNALDRLDEPGAHAILDRLLATFTLEAVLRDVVLPYLRDLGARWANGDVTVAQEHWASNLLRGRLLGLARAWGQGTGPRAVLACAPGELHDLALIAFGLALAARGWVITYLGPDTPIPTIQELLDEVDPRLVVVAATSRRRFRAAQPELTELARHVRVGLGGAGATEELARATGAILLEGDPVSAAARVSSLAP